MRLKAALDGNLEQFMKEEIAYAERAVTKGIKEATVGLKNAMRGQVMTAGLGARLSRTWRGDVYPKNASSLHAAGVVYTKADKIMQGFEYGQFIRSTDGFWLAIPTPNAPKKAMGKRITPGGFEKAKGIRLQFVYRKNGPSLLVAPNMRASYSRKTGAMRGFRTASKSAQKSGKGLTSVVMFWLVPVIKLPKLIRFEPEANKWHNRLPELIVKHWNDQQ